MSIEQDLPGVAEADDDESEMKDNNVKRPLSTNAKRRLRRERLTASRAGVVVPYQPISEPQANDGQKLTNTAKRMARKRKKFALECETLGEDEVRSKIKALVKEKKKKKKKRESSKLVICKTAINSFVKPSSKNNPGHIRFSEEEDDEPEDELSRIKAEVTESKMKEEEDEVKEDEDDEDDDNDTDLKNASEDAKNAKKSKPNKPEKKRRFVLFVGNLSYDATAEDIKVHFFKVGPIVDIRMARHVEEEKKDKCRGFCHLEVKDEETYLKALSMNHTYLGKRRINVEYSSGQTQEKRVEQKQKRAKIKEMIKTGDMFEYLNPTHGPSPSKAKRRTTAKRKTQDQGNKFWV